MRYLHTWETNLHILNVPCSHHAISTPAHILGGDCMTHDGWGHDGHYGPEVDVAVRVCLDWVVRKRERWCGYHLQPQIMKCSEMAVQVIIHVPISSNKYYAEPKLPLLCMERICLWRASDQNWRRQNRVDAYIPFQSTWILPLVLSPSHGEGTMTMAGGRWPVRLQFFWILSYSCLQWRFTLHTCYLEDCRQAMLGDVLSQSISPPQWWKQNYWYTCTILLYSRLFASTQYIWIPAIAVLKVQISGFFLHLFILI